MTVAEYMELKCTCGRTRAEHVHTYADFFLADGVTVNPSPVELRVVSPYDNGCAGFTWELERELGGNPLANKHLRPLMVQGD